MASEQGHPGAPHSLGLMYAEGRGVPKNFSVAYKWLSLAEQDSNQARQKLAIIEIEMTRDQIAEAQGLAAEFFAKQRE